MTDIETLLRDTFAAHEHLAEEDPFQVLPPLPRHRSPVLAVVAVAATLVLAVTTIVALQSNDATPSPSGQRSPDLGNLPVPPDAGNPQLQAAEGTAAQMLTAVAMRVLGSPFDATPVEGATSFFNLSGYLTDTSYRAVQSAAWSTQVADPSQVLAWFAEHPPRGFATEEAPHRVDRRGEVPREELTYAKVLSTGSPLDGARGSVLFQAIRINEGVALRVSVAVPVSLQRTAAEKLDGDDTGAVASWGDQTAVLDEQQAASIDRAFGGLEPRVESFTRCWNHTTDRISIGIGGASLLANDCGGWTVIRDGVVAGPDLYDDGHLVTLVKQAVVAADAN